MERHWWQIGGVLGIAFPILFIAGIVVQGEDPGLHAPIAEVRAFYTDHGDRYLIGGYIIGLGTVLAFLPFITTLGALLGRVEGSPALCARLTVLGGLLFVTTGLITNVAAAAAMGARDPELDAAALRTLLYVDAVTFSVMPVPIALMLLSASFVIWRTAVLWRWLAVLGLVVALVALVCPFMALDGGDEEGPFAALLFLVVFPGLGLWTLLAGINLATRRALPPESAGLQAVQADGRPLTTTA